MRTGTANPARGFTIVEVSAVVLVMGILAVGVTPALSALAGARRSAATQEVERRVVMARDTAMSGGLPTGVRIDPAAETLRTYLIASDGASPTPVSGALAGISDTLDLAERFPGAGIVSVAGGSAVAGAVDIWFGADGTPEERDSGGALIGPAAADAVITMGNAETVTVRRVTGMVTR